MDSNFIFLDRIYRIDWIFLPAARSPSVAVRSILMILSNFILKIRIHFSSIRILNNML